ncbi:MAG: LCP family protein [Promicromonosporaceae bacterium]|nr:LCP family protein [Promicromonosporaceae bacterium]
MPTRSPRHAAPRTRRKVLAGRPPQQTRGPRHAARLRTRRAARAVGMVLTAVMTFAVTAGGTVFLDLRSALSVSDVDALLAGRDDRPPEPPGDPFSDHPLTLLVMGTDYRGGANADLAGAGNEFHSDSTLLVHVSGDRSFVEVVSIARDLLVDIPACPLPDGGETRPRRNAMFNTAFAIGGGPTRDLTGAAACTILTVEAATGLRINEHVIVKMDGLIGVVDALGGVGVDLPEAVRGDHHVSLDLPAGPQRLDGDQALNFLRARGGRGMGLEMGSDLQRIERQQFFVDAMMREVLSQNVIANTPRLLRTVDAVLSSMSTSRNLAGVTAVAGLGWSLRGLDPDSIVFTPLPVAAAPSDPNRVVWVRSQTDPVWERLRSDQPPTSLVPEEPAGEIYEAAARS